MKMKKLAALLAALCMIASLIPATAGSVDAASPALTAEAGQDPLSYVDEFGQEQTITEYTVFTGSETLLSAGWYAVLSDVQFSETLTLLGDIKIVLADGCTMNVGAEKGENLQLGVLHNSENGSLTIYGQNGGTGTLNVRANRPILMSHSSGNIKPYIQNGGLVNAYDGTIGLETKSVTVNRGSLFAEGEDYGIVAPSLTVNGGTVNAHAAQLHAIQSNTVSILGGQVTALTDSNNYSAYGIKAESITLGCTEPEDFITVNKFSSNAALQIAEGQILTDGTKAFFGTITDHWLLAGKTLRSAKGLVIIDDSIWNGTVTVSQENPVEPGVGLTLTLTPQQGFEVGAVSWFDGSQTYELQPVDGVCGFTMPDGAAYVTASFTPIPLEVPYVDADGTTKTATALPIPEGENEALAAGWYVVNRNVEHNDRIIFSEGDVHLILADDCTMTVNGGGWGVYFICGYYNSANLSIYGQSKGTGVLDISNCYAGTPLAVDGTYTQNGGTLRFFNAEQCVYTEDAFTLNGGTFTGSVVNSYGLLVYSFHMNGGVFHVEAGDGNVLDAVEEVSIHGGQFTAVPPQSEDSTYCGVSGGSVTLGWTNADDFICAGSIRSSGTVQIAEGQRLTDGTTQYSGVISDPAVLDGKTLRPVNAYTITVNDCQNGTVQAPEKAYAGDSVDLTVTPDEGYGLCSLTVTDAAGNPVTVTENSFTMPESSVTVTAVFGFYIEIPTAASGLVYNGTEQIGVPAGVGYSLTGDAAATNAGSYQATASLEEGYLWSDGSTEAKNVAWSIEKAPLTITADPNSKVYGEADPKLTAVVEGAIGSDVVYYSLSRAKGENVGEYEITVTPGNNPNYSVSVNGAVFTIVKANPPYTVPKGLTAVVGQTLDQVKLPAGWSWADPTQRIEKAGKKSFMASYTPEDTENYNVLENIKLTVNAKKVRFVDVPEGSYYYVPVYWAVARGITVGTSETNFSPHQIATRAQVVTFLWRMAGSPKPKTSECSFKDVPVGAYYRKAVLWAFENGIASGINAEKFGSNIVCTREQIVFFLWKMAGKPKHSITNTPFEDVKPGSSYNSILWAYENKITAGKTKTTFDCKSGCTRAQVVTFLYRYCEAGY